MTTWIFDAETNCKHAIDKRVQTSYCCGEKHGKWMCSIHMLEEDNTHPCAECYCVIAWIDTGGKL